MKSCGDVRGRIQILQWNYHTVSCFGLPLPDMVEQASLFVTTSEREFFSCADEKTCVEKAMEEVGKK